MPSTHLDKQHTNTVQSLRLTKSYRHLLSLLSISTTSKMTKETTPEIIKTILDQK